MGNSLKQQGYDEVESGLTSALKKLSELDDAAKLDATQLALGVAGTADPTFVADAANAAISAARGDYFGAFFDGVSAIPYVGDVVGKPVRGVQLGVRSWLRGRRVGTLVARSTDAAKKIIEMRRTAAEQVKKLRREAYRKGGAMKEKYCASCNNVYGTQVPKRGKWGESADVGNGKYTAPDNNVYTFKDGYPDFEDASMQKFLRKKKPNTVDIKMTGNRDLDENLANRAAGLTDTPKFHTWHHGDDGTSMYLVPSKHHKNITPHYGGASYTNSNKSNNPATAEAF